MPPLVGRQAAGLAAVVALAAAVVTAALLDLLALALAGLGLSTVLLYLAVLRVQHAVRENAAAERSRAERAEAGQQRVLSAVDTQRRADARRQRALRRSLRSGRAETEESLKRLGGHLVRRQRDQTREVEALVQLFRTVEPRAPMPSSGHWALNPTDLLELMFVVDRVRPRRVLELGSGTSSVWLGYALEKHGGRLWSVDHDPAYAESTRRQLHRHGLAGVAEVVDAPLRPLDVGGEEFTWYDVAAFGGVADVDLLVVDGPPGTVGKHARYPALHVLEEKLCPHATVVLDDTDRADEQAIVDRWVEVFPGLVREPGTVGHQTVLTYRRPPGRRVDVHGKESE